MTFDDWWKEQTEGEFEGVCVDHVVMAWQAAERETARRCIEWIDAFSIIGDRSEHMKHGIKAAFPEQ